MFFARATVAPAEEDDEDEEEGKEEEEKCDLAITAVVAAAAAVPAYLKGRVERGEELPRVEIMISSGENEEEAEAEMKKNLVKSVVEHVVMEGKLAKELFVDLMEYMVVKWDDERKRE